MKCRWEYRVTPKVSSILYIYIYTGREREREGICVRLTVRVEITHQLVDIPELPILHYLPCSGQEAGNNRSASCPYACLLRQPYGAT